MMQRDSFSNIRRDYGAADVERLAGSFRIRHTLAEMGAVRLRHLLNTEPFVPTLGALTGNQAVQQVKAGLKAIYLSGWQVAAEAEGYTATRHQREVGVGYFDAVAMVISGGHSSTTALAGSTETAQFHEDRPADSTQHGHDEGLVHNHDWAVHDWAAQ